MTHKQALSDVTIRARRSPILRRPQYRHECGTCHHISRWYRNQRRLWQHIAHHYLDANTCTEWIEP